tara:strand:+ start:400 stop:1338 length:939 start_codon:yes stop_codon:yes gene_type:complete
MKKSIAIQMDNIKKIDFEFDSSFLIGYEAQERGYEIFYYNPQDLFINENHIQASGYFLELFMNENNYFKFKSKKMIARLDNFKFVFLRQDPPFDMNYITSTYILDLLPSSTVVVNDPTAVRNSTEKLFTFNFKEFMPPTLVTKDLNIIEEFLNKEEHIITKPLYGNGGEGIHRFDKSNFNPKILEQYLHLPIMIQKFINEIKYGDRRIVFFDGEYHGSVARIPQEGNLKANFHAGGKASKTDLVYRDKEIVETLGPKLKEHNLFFVGIDIIGNYLTEINVTSPTGLKQINALNKVKLEKEFWDKLEAKYKLV